MARRRSVLIVSFGSSQLAAARFSLNASQNLVLENYASRRLSFNFSQQSEWLPALAEAAGELLKSKFWSGEADADIIAPVFPLFLKNIRAPVVEKSRQSAVIAYEAEQNIPYEISGLAWDRQVVGGDGFDLEVMLLACHLEIAEEICRCASSMGLRPLSIRSDCLSEYCALQHSIPKNSGNTLLLKIGARSTSFLFPKAKHLYFRSIPIGGNSLTAAIAEKLKISLGKAENVKLQTPTGSCDAHRKSPQSAIIHAQTPKFMDRLSLETNRSMAHFKKQDGDAKAEKILLSGRGALLPGLADSLKNNLGLHVDFFQPLEGVQIGEDVDAEMLKRDELRLGALVGQAAATLLPNTEIIDLNVLPPRIARRRSLQRTRPFLLAAACFLGIALYLPLVHFNKNSAIYQQQIEALERELHPAESIHQDLIATLDRIEEFEQKIRSLEPLVEGKENWLAFLSDFQKRLVEVEDVWFDEMQIIKGENENSGGVSGLRLQLAGRMLDRENPLARVSANIQQRVNQLLGAFGESEFVSEVTNRKFDASARGLLRFQFTLVLNPEYHL